MWKMKKMWKKCEKSYFVMNKFETLPKLSEESFFQELQVCFSQIITENRYRDEIVASLKLLLKEHWKTQHTIKQKDQRYSDYRQ